MNLAIAAVIASVGEFFVVKDMWDRIKSGQIVKQSDYEPLSPLGIGQTSPGSMAYDPRRYVRMPDIGKRSPQQDLTDRLNAPVIHTLNVTLPSVTNGQQFLDEISNPRSVLYQGTTTHPNVPNTITVGHR